MEPMKMIVILHKQRGYLTHIFFSLAAFFFALSFLSACASSGLYPSLSIGEPKNSIPFFEKNLIEELHSIVVPPFRGDQHNWHEIAGEILSSSGRVSLIPSGKITAFLKSSKTELSSLSQEERLDVMARLGRATHADAVLNGAIINRNGQQEIILQLISSRDSRTMWWQASDFSSRADSLSQSDRMKVLSSVLSPLLAYAGKKVTQPSTQMKQEPEVPEMPAKEGEQRPKRPGPKQEKKPDKNQKPSAGDISPM